jgi:sugar/nucleoside kinase (ribokinase family)
LSVQVALDSLETPAGTVDNALGGAATYGSVAASLFAPVHLVGVVGDDFPREHIAFLQGRNIDLAGLQVIEGWQNFSAGKATIWLTSTRP